MESKGAAVSASAITKYAILTRRSDLQLHLSAEVPRDLVANADSQNRLSAEEGTLIKVFQTHSPASSHSKAFSTVQILDFVRHQPIYENLYECPQVNLCKVSEDLWPYVISIESPERRLHMVQSQQDHCRWIVYLKPNDFVSVPGTLFGNSALRYDCIVRYIGPVQELHPVGYFFGLELLHLDCGRSPQSEDIPFAIKYMNCEPSLSIFTTADRIRAVSTELKKKFSALDLISGTFEKVRTAIAPSITAGGGIYGGGGGSSATSGTASWSNTNSLRRGRKPKKEKEATAQFYAIPATPEARQDASNPLDRNFGNLIETTTSSAAVSEMDGNSKRKQQLQSQTANVGVVSDNEEFTQSIENYEKTLERQHAGMTSNGGGGSANHIPYVSLPAGILKKPPPQTSGASNKPLTIMSLEDRDIIVIDKADIRESTRHEANVIVVDKQRGQQEVDLADLLGGNWPHNAGDAASMLNKAQLKQQQQELKLGSAGGSSNSSVSSLSQSQKSASQTTQIDRNRSPNPMQRGGATSVGLQKAEQRSVAFAQASASGHFNNSNRINSAVFENDDDLPPVGTIRLNEEKEVQERERENGNEKQQPEQEKQQQQLLQLQEQEPEPEPPLIASPMQEVPGDIPGLGVGSMVEVYIPDADEEYYGVIRWIGMPPNFKKVMVGVELEDEPNDRSLVTSNGSFSGVRLFKCNEGRALFVAPDCIAIDRRFQDDDGSKSKPTPELNAKMFGNVECPPVKGIVVPRKCFNLSDLEEICGKFKGVQGHHNSCYLDATVFAMFMFTYVFDSLMYRKPAKEDISEYREVQQVIHEEIVNPLRKNLFVRADKVMKLRELLDKLSSVSGLTTEEKDPEEFLSCLLSQIMRVEPFLQLSPGGQESYYYQLFVEKDERLTFPTVQQLFEQSFHASDIKLLEVPSCLIIQMPRFGKNYKMYPRILPSQVLDVTDIIDDSPRQCTVCGKLAEFECRDCFGIMQGTLGGLECTSFCGACLTTVHQHSKRANHTYRPLTVPADFLAMAKHTNVPRRYMELFAVVCIETSHYVTFARAGPSPDSPWCFFDSMADRKGEHNGYNIPEVVAVPELTQWLTDEGARTVNETSSNDKMLPEHAKRLFCDAYMCMYQSKEVMMYR